jgi:hypothetical protein
MIKRYMASLPIAMMFKNTTVRYGHADVQLVKACTTQQLQAFSLWPEGTKLMGRVPNRKQLQIRMDEMTAYTVEKRKSSDVYLFNGMVAWKGHPNIEQLMLKEKRRTEIRLLWEYVMLSTWQKLLAAYSEGEEAVIGAPYPFKVEGNRRTGEYHTLAMTFCPGLILGKLSSKPYDTYASHIGGKRVPAYLSIAYYLGRLAGIKESEELLHDDYVLRHLIYDPAPKAVNTVTLQKSGKFLDWIPTSTTEFNYPRLWMIDVEGSHQEPKQVVQGENERLFSDYRKVVKGRSNIRALDSYYRDGYNSVDRKPCLEEIKKWQLEKMGVNMDFLF